jgi:SAM-dependent methyltransferase
MNGAAPNSYWQSFFDRRAGVHGASYRTSAYANSRSFRRHRDLLATAFADGAQVPLLDAGCGVGAMTESLAEAGVRVIGIDYSIGSIAAAGDRRLRPVAGDLTSLPFCDESFARIASVGVIQHFTDPARMLRELLRVTRRGGDLVIATTNAECLAVRAHRSFQRLLGRREDFSRLFGAHELAALARTSGWEVVAWQTVRRSAERLRWWTRVAAPSFALRLRRAEGE